MRLVRLGSVEAANTIEARGLTREFKKGPRAVDAIDLHVDAGEIYGFLGPNEAPPRPGDGARASADDPLPRRADNRPRRAEPDGAVGGGRTPGARGRRDRLPDDAVPRGGGRARRPGRDHRPRADRRRRD